LVRYLILATAAIVFTSPWLSVRPKRTVANLYQICQLCQIDNTEIIGDFYTINSLETSGIFMVDDFRAPPPYSNNSDAFGRRVRLRPKPDAALQIYGGNGLLQPLRETNGMVWPYQPQITYEQNVEYSSMDMVHVNQEIYAYNRTNALKLSVQGPFSVQNQQEGLYALAAIHFLRTVTKMYFGTGDNLGTPPPVLLFDAYGQYMFNKLPVIVTNFAVELPTEVDYVPVDLSNVQTYSDAQAQTNLPGYSKVQTTPQLQGYTQASNAGYIASKLFNTNLNSSGGYVWLPAVFTITVAITVQNTAAKLRSFDLNQFRTGYLMKQGRWI
jgi:hypothetical protein